MENMIITEQPLPVVLPSISFWFIVLLHFFCCIFCRAFNFSPLYSPLSIFDCPSVCCLRRESSFCHSSNDLLCVWISFYTHSIVCHICPSHDLYHIACMLQFHSNFSHIVPWKSSCIRVNYVNIVSEADCGTSVAKLPGMAARVPPSSFWKALK